MAAGSVWAILGLLHSPLPRPMHTHHPTSTCTHALTNHRSSLLPFCPPPLQAPEIIAVSQDPLGVAGDLVWQHGPQRIYAGACVRAPAAADESIVCFRNAGVIVVVLMWWIDCINTRVC